MLLENSLIFKDHFFLVIIVELADSPIGCIVVVLFLRGHLRRAEFIRVHDLLGNGLILCRFLVFCGRDQACSESIDLRLDLLLSLSSLLFSELLVHVLVDSFGTSRSRRATCHLLAHHLLERTVLLEFESSFGLVLLLSLFFLFLPESIDVGFGQNACFMRLPFDIVKLLERFLLHKNL